MSTAAWILGLAATATASPQLGGDCHYCHGLEQPEAMSILGFDEEVEIESEDGLSVTKVKVFEVEPGGEVDFEFDVNNPGQPVF